MPAFQKRSSRSVDFIRHTGFFLGILSIVWAVGLFQFAAEIPREVRDRITPTDSIVVLTGARGRLTTGLDLLAKKLAKKMFVSGVYRGVDVSTLLEISKRKPENLDCCIELGHSADDTAGNATETASWMQGKGYNSLRLVTSSYHLPRSLLEFRHAMPEVSVVPHPVFHSHVKQEQWWAWPGTTGLIIGEYHKFLLAWLEHTVMDSISGGNTKLQ